MSETQRPFDVSSFMAGLMIGVFIMFVVAVLIMDPNNDSRQLCKKAGFQNGRYVFGTGIVCSTDTVFSTNVVR